MHDIMEVMLQKHKFGGNVEVPFKSKKVKYKQLNKKNLSKKRSLK